MDSTHFTWSAHECLKAGYLPGEAYAIKEVGPRVEVTYWYAATDVMDGSQKIHMAPVSQFMSSVEKAREAADILQANYPYVAIAEVTTFFNRSRSTDEGRMRRLIHGIG